LCLTAVLEKRELLFTRIKTEGTLQCGNST
jgi:hypothetical protein